MGLSRCVPCAPWMMLCACLGCSDSSKRQRPAGVDATLIDGASVGDAGGDIEAQAPAASRDAARDASVDPVGPLDAPAAPFGISERPANATCVAPGRPTSVLVVAVEEPFPGLTFTQPVALRPDPHGSRWLVAQRAGTIVSFRSVPGTQVIRPFLDITDRVNSGRSELGLLGFALDPDFPENGVAYVSYTGFGGPKNVESRVSRFVSLNDGRTLDAASEEVLLALPQPFANHNGGDLAFGPDGYLYVSFGDGGGAGDPGNRAQDPHQLYGKVLRLDVRGGAAPYGIPPDNPFASGGGAPEVFALGFRNPWRMSFDRSTGDLWLGDVGQHEWEEVDRVERGGNYGWRVREGQHCFEPATGCSTAGLIDPVIDYPHSVGRIAIGGYVYRGARIPALDGSYVFGDLYNGAVSRVVHDPVNGAANIEDLIDTSYSISAFGQGTDGELYFVDYTGGRLYAVAPAASPDGGAGEAFPQKLSATGCVDPTDATHVAPGMIPFDVNSPLWSDGADKQRWFAIPDSTSIQVNSEGDWELPIGSVVMKTFSSEGIQIETRLLVRHDDGEWAGYTYLWNAAGTDADLLEGATTKLVGGKSWYIPNRAECLGCHTAAAGRTLGLEHGQVDRDFIYPGGIRANQIDTLEHIGVLSPFTGAASTFPAPQGIAPVDDRARSYLHANCSMCHRPGGAAFGDLDLRFETPLAMTRACDAEPTNGDMGIPDAAIVAPGDPDRSILSSRMVALDAHRMPPIATRVADPTGTALVASWIRSLTDCR